MRRFSDLPIGQKLTWTNVLTSGVALLLAATAVLVYEVVTFRRTLVEELDTQVRIIGYNVTSALLFDDRAAATSTLGALKESRDVVGARVYGRDGQPFATYVRAGGRFPEALDTPPVAGTRRARFGGNQLVVFGGIVSDGERVGSIRIVSDLTQMNTRLRGYVTIVALVFLAASIGAVLISARLQRAITDPILDLVAKARQVSERQDYGVRAVRTGRDETGLLVDSFNDMLGQIQTRDTALAQARDAAEAANRAKDEFLAVVSHELRTPLTPIIAWVRMLRGGQLEQPGVARALDVIERNARSQAQLVSDLLDVSRIIAGKVRLDVQEVELAPLLEAAIDSSRPAADAKGIRIQVLLDPRAGTVAGDPERLQQVFWNLLSNAIKFTPKGGRVQVRLQRVNSHLEVSVQDTGQGIRPDFLPYVFDRFRQADPSSTRRHGGLGLGLAIVRHMVELHGGRVRVESAGDGQGATFSVELPLSGVRRVAGQAAVRVHPTAEAQASFEPTPVLTGIRILAVDDDHDTLETLRVILAACGAEVRTATSAAEGIAVLEAWRPDLLISDLGMPEEDGYSLIRRVRALPAERGGAIPAVALTAYARLEDRLKVLAAGFQMHAPKPIEPAELVAIVSSMAEWVGKGQATRG